MLQDKENKEKSNEEEQNNENEGENNNENTDNNNDHDLNNETEELENYDNIISLSFIIQSDTLKNNNHQDKGFAMNGLQRFGCQTIIYMPKNMFYITSPSFSQEGYCLWNLGWLDVRNQLFYQTNTLTNNLDDRISYFSCWLEFLQTLIDNKIYTKLFEFFNFDKAILYNNDRFINENIFIQSLKQLGFCKDNENEMIPFMIPMFKSSNKMISLALVKKIISSNLKNFSDEAMNEKVILDNNSSINTTNNKNDINVNEVEENENSDEKENNNE
jgi:hypothetical protein